MILVIEFVMTQSFSCEATAFERAKVEGFFDQGEVLVIISTTYGGLTWWKKF